MESNKLNQLNKVKITNNLNLNNLNNKCLNSPKKINNNNSANNQMTTNKEVIRWDKIKVIFNKTWAMILRKQTAYQKMLNSSLKTWNKNVKMLKLNKLNSFKERSRRSNK